MSGMAIKAATGFRSILQSQRMLLAPSSCAVVGQPLRGSKHWNPKWKKLRKEKFIPLPKESFHRTEASVRRDLKARGLYPLRPIIETPFFSPCTPTILEPYVPPEGDGKLSALSKIGAQQKVELVGKKGKTLMAVRTIRTYDENFTAKTFPEEAQEIYIKAHEALANKDKQTLRMTITETAIPLMMHNTYNKTIRWKFLESLEPPRVVHIVNTPKKEESVFAQVTVRFHNQQTLAVYDRFGRLMSGSEILKKDVLEYVVFEKLLNNEYGHWRIHGKVTPSWAPPPEAVQRTLVEPVMEEEDEDEEEEGKKAEGNEETATASLAELTTKSDSPQTKAP